MGYNVSIESVQFSIPIENLDEAYKRFMEMSTKYHHLKHGVRYGPGIDPDAPENRWFSWMNGYETEDKDAQEVLQRLGFYCIGFDDRLYIEGWEAEKAGQADLFLNEISDLVDADSHIEWLGEDGARWRWEFDGSTMITREAKVVWE